MTDAQTFLISLQYLAKRAREQAQAMWHIRPKHHAFEHIKDDMEVWDANPLRLHCMAPETFMGRVKLVGKQCHGKSSLQRIPERFVLAYSVRWEERRSTQRWRIPVA